MLTQILSTIWSFLEAILVLLFMVTVHEFGHYITGKKLGFEINEFSIGFGPAIFKKKMKTGEDFSIRALPLGGYCAFEGEDENSDNPKAFDKQAPWKRIIVLIAGATMNFLSTLLIVILTFEISGQYVFTVGEVLPYPEEAVKKEYVLEKNDKILSVNGVDILLSTDLDNVLSKAKSNGDPYVSVELIRGEKRQTVDVPLRDYVAKGLDEKGNEITQKGFGIGISPSSDLHRFGFFESIGRAFDYCFKMVGEIFVVLGQLFGGKLALTGLSGPVSTITITAEVASQGFRQLLELVTLIGVNLAVFNLLPIPALDGCKVVITTVEWITGKPVNKKVEGILDTIGFVLLIGFAVLVDLLKVL